MMMLKKIMNDMYIYTNTMRAINVIQIGRNKGIENKNK